MFGALAIPRNAGVARASFSAHAGTITDMASENQPAVSDACRSLLLQAVRSAASDLHLVPGHPPTLRVHGKMVAVGNAVLTREQARAMIESLLPQRLQARLATEKNLDFSIDLEAESSAGSNLPVGEMTPQGRGARKDSRSSKDQGGNAVRFRANVFLAQGDWCACLRHIPDEIPSFEWMGFSRGLAERLVNFTNGLVVITGVTGSGKSTTLAAMVNLLNERGGQRVITVEEPIEYVHPRISTTVITQREVGRDVDSFYDGLKYGLRQDPNVILLGEIRDRDTAQMALSAAETGHLILTTLHTKDAKGAITRLTDLFPFEAQEDVRTQLALSMRSVVSQHLLPAAREGDKRALALEVLHVNQQVRIAIRFGKIESIESALQTGKRDGMVTLDDDLMRLVLEKRITMETARRFAKDPQALGGA